MVDTPFVKQFRDEHVATFERRASLLRMTATTEAVIKGNQAEFLVAGSGGAKAVTRGSNGKIPFGSTTNTQNTVTLKEAHAPFERSGFNVFASQGNQRRIMQEESVGTLNRDIDDTLIAELDTTTQNTGAAVTASLALVVKSQTILGNADVEVEDEDNMFCVATPAFRAYLMQIPEFSSADYMDVKIFAGPTVKMKRWAGCAPRCKRRSTALWQTEPARPMGNKKKTQTHRAGGKPRKRRVGTLQTGVGRLTFSKARFFGLLMLLMALANLRAFSSEAFKEAWVFSFCRSGETFAEMHVLFAQGDVTAARMHYRLKVAAGDCTDYTRYGLVVSFKGVRIAARYESLVQGKTAVLEGHIVNADNSSGEKAFVWVAEAHLANFLEILDGKPMFEPAAPEFKGWQDT